MSDLFLVLSIEKYVIKNIDTAAPIAEAKRTADFTAGVMFLMVAFASRSYELNFLYCRPKVNFSFCNFDDVGIDCIYAQKNVGLAVHKNYA